MTICYFSASGNSLYVARRVGGKLLSIPKLVQQGTIEIEDDAVGIVSPVYLGGLPLMVQDFLERVSVKTDYLFFLFTCGNGGSFDQVMEIGRSRGLDFQYCNIIRMVDNFLPGFEMQEQIDTLPQKNVEGQLDVVCADIAARKEQRPQLSPPGMAPMVLFRKRLVKKILRRDAAHSYIVDANCILCGVCAKVCPANNITIADGKVSFADCCEVCYACVHNCPKGAIHVPGEKSSARFRNENVTLQDMIEANS